MSTSHGLIAAGLPTLVELASVSNKGKVAMGTFVGLDVSLEETSVCILDQDGTGVVEGKGASDPAAIARLIRKQAPDLARVGLESGPTSVWLTHSLKAEGLPVVCLDARHAQAVLSVRPNKTDRSDARGLAEMVGSKRCKSRAWRRMSEKRC